jgi:hypothetical protein
MRYELLLQPALSGAPFETDGVEAALTERKAVQRADGAWVIALPHGELEISPLREEGQLKALVMKVPLSHQLELIREALHWGLDLTRETGLSLVDPRVSRALSIADEGSLTDAYFQTAKYAGEYMGVSEAVLASYGTHEPVGISVQAKVFIAIAAFIGAVFWALSRWQ